jgi:hypothetical protein
MCDVRDINAIPALARATAVGAVRPIRQRCVKFQPSCGCKERRRKVREIVLNAPPPGINRNVEDRQVEAPMDDRTFIILFFPSFFISMGVFFAGVGVLWWISIQNRELKRRNRE